MCQNQAEDQTSKEILQWHNEVLGLDVTGPFLATLAGKERASQIVDNATWHTWSFPLKPKDESLEGRRS